MECLNPLYFTEISLYLNNKNSTQTESSTSKKRKLFENNRCFIFDTLTHIGLKFQLQDRTLFLAFDYFDLYFKDKDVSHSIYHLFFYGLVSLIIAVKFEETYPPHNKVKYPLCVNVLGVPYDGDADFEKRPTKCKDF
jgi:hypothetical protein